MLAIIIPYYKKTFFRETLQSLANQTDKRFKVYVGNDASPENPEDLIAKFKDKFDLTYHKFEENMGEKSLVKQWGRCIALSKNEEWMTILGDDDTYSENVIEAFYDNIENIKKHHCTVVRYATQVINQEKKTISKKFIHPQLETDIDFINRKFTKQTRSSLSEHFFKQEIINFVGFAELPMAWHSDDLAIINCAKSKFKAIYSINEATIFIKVSEQSITGSSQTIQKKAVATQEFILKYIVPIRRKIKRETIKVLHQKLEHSFFISKSNKFLLKIIGYYITNLEFYALTRFMNVYAKIKINERNQKA